MKSNELRIGNYYLSFGVDLKQVETLHKDKILIDFTPIPLTEEWLLKFGFIHSKLFDCDLFTSSWNFHISVLSGEYQLNYKESAKSQWIPLIKIKHVHTLQNLYFALTNEELTLKK